jgi:uncharacterized coiled-coil protein SlyX
MNCVSINPVEAHWQVHAGVPASYNLNTENPPRVWACAHIGDVPVSDRNDPQFTDVFRGNYFDEEPPTMFATECVVGGMEVEIAAYPDLSVLMETDENGHMSEEQVLAFRAKVMSMIKPTIALTSPIPTSELSAPPNYTMSVPDGADFNGTPYANSLPLGPFVSSDSDESECCEDHEERIANLETVVAEQMAAIGALTENVALLASNSTNHAIAIDNIEHAMSEAGEALLGINQES